MSEEAQVVESTTTIDEIFSSDEPAQVVEAKAPEVEVKETETEVAEADAPKESVEAESDKGVNDGTPPSEEQSVDAPDDFKGALTGMLNEREKRQKAEQETEKLQSLLDDPETLKARLQELEPESDEEFDPFDQNAVKAAALKEVAPMVKSLQDKLINQSERSLKAEKTDYDEKKAKFVEMVRLNPELVPQMREHEDPARFLYDAASRQVLLDEIGSDPDAYVNRLVEERMKAQEDPVPTETEQEEKVDPSLATAAGAKESKTPSKSKLSDMFAGSAF